MGYTLAVPPAPTDPRARLLAVLRALQSRYGPHVIRFAAEVAAQPVATAAAPPLSSGSLGVDLLVGGLPRGQLSEYAGPDGAGKESLALAAAAACQRDGGLVLLVDADNAADPDALAAAGIDLAHLILSAPASAREAWDVLRVLCRCGALDLLLVTSLSGLLLLPGAGWGPRYLERRLDRLRAVLHGRRTALLVTNTPIAAPPVSRGTALPPRWETVGGRPLAQATAFRVALWPAGVRMTPYGDVGALAAHARVVKHHGQVVGPDLVLEITPLGPRRAAELIALGKACGCITHTRQGVTMPGRVLGRSAARAAAALEADPAATGALEVAVRAGWKGAPFRPAAGDAIVVQKNNDGW
jgi:RecA/RadA recombinase